MTGTTGSLLPKDARLRKVATGATWSEGPLWIPQTRSLRWSDIPGNRILEYRIDDGETRVYAEGVEFTNGRTLAADGSVIQCSHGNRRVERDVDGVVTGIVSEYDGVRLNSPNDVITARDGSIWFTDPPYGITVAAEGHPGEKEYGGCYVFRYDLGTGVLRPMVIDIEDPNGLAFSPDESLLYVSDTSFGARPPEGGHHIRVYDVRDGRCLNGRGFATVETGASDGFRVDVQGNVWSSAGDGVRVFAPDGSLREFIAVPEIVANVCFGGEDGTTLFIAASTSIYAIPTLTTDAAARA